MQTKVILILSFLATMSFGCSSAKKEVQYSKDTRSAADFAKKTLVGLSGHLDKILSKKNSREYQENGFNIFTTHFFPRHGPSSIINSFSNYCSGIGGNFTDGLCSYNNEKEGYFILKTTVIGEAGGTLKVRIDVIEPKTVSNKAIVALAKRNGYLNKIERKQRATQRGVTLKSFDESRIQARLGYNVGAKVCGRVALIPLGKIQGGKVIAIQGQNLRITFRGAKFWDKAKNWYPCN